MGGRLGRTTALHRYHANTPYSWRIPPSRQGFNVLFGFIHQGRSVHLFQRVFGAVGGCLPVLAGVWGCCPSVPTCFGLDMSIRGAYVSAMYVASLHACVCVCVCVRA